MGRSVVTETSSGSGPKAREQKRLEADARQSRSRARQELERDLSAVEERILELELRQKELTSFLEQPDRYENSVRPAQAGRELTSLTQELESLSLQWERLVDIAQNMLRVQQDISSTSARQSLQATVSTPRSISVRPGISTR